MTVKDLTEKIQGNIVASATEISRDVSGMYICDMLSHAMAGVSAGDAWVTILNNKNILAVAVLTELSCIVIAENVELDESIKQKAEEENIILISSPLNAYQIAAEVGKI